MANKVLYSADGAVIREFVVDDDDNLIGFNTRQDCTDALREVQESRDLDEGQGKDWKLAARIPVAFVDKMFQEGSFNDPTAWKKLLNDPDLKAFRVYEGRV